MLTPAYDDLNSPLMVVIIDIHFVCNVRLSLVIDKHGREASLEESEHPVSLKAHREII